MFSFVENKADLGETEANNTITCAVENNQVDCLQILLDLNIWEDLLSLTVSDDGEVQSLVSVAVNNNSPECLDLLIKRDAFIEPTDPEHGYTPVFFATVKGHAKCLDLLLTAGASIVYHEDSYKCHNDDCKVQLPIHTAAGLGQVECLKVLLNHIDDPGQRKPRDETMIDVTDDHPRTAFWIAAYNRKFECMITLLEAGADPRIGRIDRCGPFSSVPFTPLGAVIHHKHLCRECKLKGVEDSGEIIQAHRDYAHFQEPIDCRKCTECEIADCECDAVEKCMEIFSMDNMGKYIQKIPGLHTEAVKGVLNSGLVESIHIVRPDLLELTLRYGADLYEKVGYEYDVSQLDNFRTISVPTALYRLTHNDVQSVRSFMLDDKGCLVISVISFLQWTALFNPSSTSDIKEDALKCLQVIIDDYSSSNVYGSDMKQNTVGEMALLHLAGSTWMDGFKLVVESGLVNINCISQKYNISPIFTALEFPFNPIQKLQLLLFHGASAKLPEMYDVLSKCLDKVNVTEIVKSGWLLLAAGFPKDYIHSLFRKVAKNPEVLRNDSKEIDMVNKFMNDSELDGVKCLLNCCRDTIGHHLIEVNPHTNLFHLVPQLPLPLGVQNFLLYNMQLT